MHFVLAWIFINHNICEVSALFQSTSARALPTRILCSSTHNLHKHQPHLPSQRKVSKPTRGWQILMRASENESCWRLVVRSAQNILDNLSIKSQRVVCLTLEQVSRRKISAIWARKVNNKCAMHRLTHRKQFGNTFLAAMVLGISKRVRYVWCFAICYGDVYNNLQIRLCADGVRSKLAGKGIPRIQNVKHVSFLPQLYYNNVRWWEKSLLAALVRWSQQRKNWNQSLLVGNIIRVDSRLINL